MPLVKAQCTNCGGILEVEASKDAAICPHCGTPYIVEKAIQHFNVNNTNIIQNATFNMKASSDELWFKAQKLLEYGERLKAFEIIEQILNDYVDDVRPVAFIAEQVYEECVKSTVPICSSAFGRFGFVANRYTKMVEDNLFEKKFQKMYQDCMKGELSQDGVVGFLDYPGSSSFIEDMKHNAYIFRNHINQKYMELAPRVFVDLLFNFTLEYTFDDNFPIPFITFSSREDLLRNGAVDYGTSMYIKERFKCDENIWGVWGILGFYVFFKSTISNDFLIKKMSCQISEADYINRINQAYSQTISNYLRTNTCVNCGVGSYKLFSNKCWSCGSVKPC